MSYSSIAYILFLSVAVLAFYLCKNRFQWILLLIANISFYLIADYKMCIFLGVTILTTWEGALWIEKLQDKLTLKRVIFIITLIINIGFLLLFKTSFVSFLDKWVGHPLNLVAPIGLSFYTFQLLGYLIDTYWGGKAEKNLGHYMLFASFFPQIISGPISRYRELSPQFASIKIFNIDKICLGIERILWGTFKKMVVADRAALFVNEVYGKPTVYRGCYAIVATLLFVIQLYCDFSGCIDIALGSAELFQVKLPENFAQPFFSRSISEFWRRWHITLGTWFKDYLFYPLLKSSVLNRFQGWLKKYLGKKRAQNCTTYIGMFFLWLFIGLWHGFEGHYIIGAGLIYWVIIVGGKILKPFTQWLVRSMQVNVNCKSYIVFETIRTIILFSLAIVFWRASRVDTATYMLTEVFTYYNPWIFFDGQIYNVALNHNEFNILLFSIIVVGIVEYLQQKESIRKQLRNQNKLFRIMIYFSLIMLIAVFGQYGPGFGADSFIYGKF